MEVKARDALITVRGEPAAPDADADAVLMIPALNIRLIFSIKGTSSMPSHLAH
jgi:hypothetical protein